MASTTTSNARESIADATSKVQDTVKKGMDKAKDLAGSASETADKATSKVGQTMSSLGESLRENTPDSGLIGQAASKVADALEGSGRYLSDEGLSGIADDVTALIKRNPVASVFIGIAIGFLLARGSRN